MNAADEATRRRGLLVMLAVFIPVTAMVLAFNPGNRLVAAVAVGSAFAVLIIVVMLMWSIRPGWFVARAGPLNDLAPEDRRLVSWAVRSGEAVPDPGLAELAASLAGRTAGSAWLMIGIAVLNLATQAWSLAETRNAAGLVLRGLSTGLFFAYLAFGVLRLSRARRAETLNRALVRQVGGGAMA